MEIIGIICEYNPFHNGHIYHIEKIKEKYPDSLLILVLNGYYLERGEISLLDKFSKTSIALNNGVDLVMELPYIYGTQSADTFAKYSIKILNELKVNKIIFGSEINNPDKLKEIAHKQINNDLDVKSYLDEGYNYPTALGKSIGIEFAYLPNDLLGISYTKEILKNKYNIEIETIKRTNDYHDTGKITNIISAESIRNKIKAKEDIISFVPDKIINKINNINEDLLFNILKTKIITEPDLSIYEGMDEGIENKILKVINDTDNYQELIKKVKSKRYTYNRLNRLFIHLLMGLTKEDNKNSKLDYLRVLGFNNEGKKYLNKIKKEINIPLKINKNSLIYKYEIKASIVYDLLTNSNTYQEELKNQPLKNITDNESTF